MSIPEVLSPIPTFTVPAFSDIAKPSNDLLSKDFCHTAATTVEVKSKAPNGVSFKVNGRSTHEGHTGGQLEAKYTDSASGISSRSLHAVAVMAYCASIIPKRLNLTQAWTTQNSLDTKLELENSIAKGLKAEVLTHFLPATQAKGAKVNLFFKQPSFHVRAFFDLFRGPTATLDAVIGHEGFLAGAEAAYDVQKATITRYSAAVGYTVPEYTAAVTATNNLSIFSASYYHRVNSQVEAGARATWDSKGSNNVGLELASKYRLDPTSFAKAKINDRGLAALAYNVVLRPGVTLGLGTSFDTQNLTEGGHKVGASLTFES